MYLPNIYLNKPPKAVLIDLLFLITNQSFVSQLGSEHARQINGSIQQQEHVDTALGRPFWPGGLFFLGQPAHQVPDLLGTLPLAQHLWDRAVQLLDSTDGKG